MKSKKTSLIPIILGITVGVTTAILLTTGIIQNPLRGNQNNFEILQMQQMHGIYFDEPSENSISIEKAAQIGVDTLEHFFDVNLDGVIIHMNYMARGDIFRHSATDDSENIELFTTWADKLDVSIDELLDYFHFYSPYSDQDLFNRTGVSHFGEFLTKLDTTSEEFWNAHFAVWSAERTVQPDLPEQPSIWGGIIMPQGATDFYSAVSEFGFAISAETGEVMTTSHYPYAFLTVDTEPPENRTSHSTFYRNFTAQQNYEFAIHGMHIAESLNIFDAKVERAKVLKIDVWLNGWDIIDAIVVWVQSENGNNGQLIFAEYPEYEKRLVSVTLWDLGLLSWDDQGNITIGHSELDFDWIYR